ncbi:MAG: Ig-like domain-containing protein [Elusimicrobia bacterium]|nr:Ig-like domain-containing protein [Elusimicrobiota bacterium]
MAVMYVLFILLASIFNTTQIMAATVPPAKIAYFITGYPTSKSITLVWRAPINDGYSGSATKYDIRYSVSAITTESAWGTATQVTSEPNPKPAGSVETFIVTGLSPSTQYYFAIKSGDEASNWSGLSNSPSNTTLALTDTTPPAAITDLATSNATAKSIKLKWSAPLDVGPAGMPSRYIPYDIRYYTSPITDINWDSATQVTGTPTPKEPSSQEEFVVAGLSPSTIYYFAVKTADDVPNWSALSNIPSGTTPALTDSVPPAAINDLAISNTTPASITLTWTAPGSNGNTGRVSKYEMRYRSLPIVTESDWNLATPIEMNKFENSDGWAGANQSCVALGVSPNSQYYFAIKTADNVPNWSGISNSPGIKTPTPATPPNNNLLFHEGAVFPNTNLAPMNPPYIISWFAGGGEQLHETSIVSAYIYIDKSWHDTMVRKRKLPIPFTYAVRVATYTITSIWYLETEEKMYANYLKIAREGYYGLDIDEWAPWDSDTRAQKSINALRRVRQQYPNFFVMAAYYGGSMDDVISGGADAVDLYTAEMYIYRGFRPYNSYIKDFIDWIKLYGLEGKNIGILSGRDDYNGLPPDIDLWIKYLRAASPQMAGLGLEIFKLYDSPTEDRAKYDKVMYDNFFKPSPTVSITAPTYGEVVRGTAKIAASATKNPETNSSVISYRYFIDTKLVKISQTPEYFWDTTEYTKGEHTITVHAVADDYLVGVNQIIVSVVRLIGLKEKDVYAYPNPSKINKITIRYSVPNPNHTTKIRIYNLAGELVKLVKDDEITRTPPKYEFIWNTKNIASGIYFYILDLRELDTNEKVTVKKKLAIIK